jgi:hypothetical protein
MTASIGLKDLVTRTRDELVALDAAAREAGPTFQVEEVVVEVHVVVTKAVEGQAGFDLKVVTVGGKGQYQQNEVHKVTVRLKPFGMPRGQRGFGEIAMPVPAGERLVAEGEKPDSLKNRA